MTDPYVVEFTVEGEDFLVAGEASNSIKETLKMLGVPSSICRRAAVITYEAEMNLVIHARGGTLRAEITPEKIELAARDEGPGIADVEMAMREGYSTAPDHVRELGFGAGMGLPNIKRNADALHIDSVVGKGTELRAIIYFREDDDPGGDKRRGTQ